MKSHLLLGSIALLTLTSNAFAYSPIIHSFASPREEGMGNVRYTTGEFEENLYANPARMTDIQENLLILPRFYAEAGSNTISSLGDISKSGSGLGKYSSLIGKPISMRFQTLIPGYFKKNFWNKHWSFGIGLLASGQAVGEVSQSGIIDPTAVINVGPAITIARRLLPEDRLSIGVTTHVEYRASSGKSFSMLQFFQGNSISDSLKGGSGAGVDFDLGTTFKPHWTFLHAEYQVGFAINNVLNGKSNIGGKIAGWNKEPLANPRTYNFGVSATHKHFFFFDSFVLAVETTDIGNNTDGSFYRTLHLGSEVKWKRLAARAGINQGYFTAGLGLNLGYFDVNVATYGEELGLNAGTVEDRRYALEFGFKF